MKFIHESEQTQVYLEGHKITKIYQGDEAEERFERELSFYKTYKSVHIPTFVTKTSRPEFSLTTELLRSDAPGFLDQTEAGFLNPIDFERIREAIFEVQNMPREKLLIHGDLAPHNIYLTESRVVLADWDSYWFTNKMRYRMYDYAFLWCNFDFNEINLAKIFKEHELPKLTKLGLKEDFAFCYKKRVEHINKYSDVFQSGVILKKEVLSLL